MIRVVLQPFRRLHLPRPKHFQVGDRSEASMAAGHKPCRCGAGESCGVNLRVKQSRAYIPASNAHTKMQELRLARKVLLPVNPLIARCLASSGDLPAKEHWVKEQLEPTGASGSLFGERQTHYRVKVDPDTGALFWPSFLPHDRSKPRPIVTPVERGVFLRAKGAARGTLAARARRLSSDILNGVTCRS